MPLNNEGKMSIRAGGGPKMHLKKNLQRLDKDCPKEKN